MKKVFICSPYSVKHITEPHLAQHLLERNIGRAHMMCLLAVKQGCNPFAPHLFYPQFLDDDILEQREAGISCGSAFLKVCDEMWVLDVEPSKGMQCEINLAKVWGIPIMKIPLSSLITGDQDAESDIEI